MHRSQTFIVALSLVVGGLMNACGVQPVPAEPTFEADVKPIMLSRCVRCHGAGGSLNADPDHGGVIPGGAPFDGFFDRLDGCNDAAQIGCNGLGIYFTNPSKKALLVGYIHSTDDASRMPPPPSPLLTSRQIEVIDNWLAEPAPL